VVIEEASAEAARRLAVALRAALADVPLRTAAAKIGVHHSTLHAVLQGRSWPDLETLVRIDRGLGVRYWTGSE
jgi:transcriptional regulator with XRE-family HTH domain